MDGISALVLLAVIGLVYFLPAVVASRRDHVNGRAIFVLNLFLGWTLIGWVAALVWAYTSNGPTKPVKPPPTAAYELQQLRESGNDEATCPFCAETIKAAAIVCRHCGRDLPKAA